MTPLDAALYLVKVGFSVIPILADGSKAPACSWKEFQERIATEEEIHFLFRGHVGIAIIGGKVSSNLEIIDIEAEAPMADLVNLIDEHLPGLLQTLPQVNTPTGGRHIFYRCSEIQPSQKLAMSAEGKVLIETRGEGGYVLTVTSPPECHRSGKIYTAAAGKISLTPVITPQQRDILLSCCRSFNQSIPEVERPALPLRDRGEGKSPGDAFNETGDGLGLLIKAGWKVVGKSNGSAYLRRPGKDYGVSASFGNVAPNTLYNFSSNAIPFEAGRKYDAFGIFARLEANGDFSQAARMLRADGWGDPSPKNITPPLPKPNGHAVTQSPVEQPAQAAGRRAQATEDLVALEFEGKFREQLRYCDAWGQWLHWNSSKWEADHTLLAFHHCREVARSLNETDGKAAPSKASFARGVEAFAKASRTFATTNADWDRNSWLLNQPTGTVNLRTFAEYPHVKTDYITKCTRIAPADGPHPVFDLFMRDICLRDEALIQYHQRSLGACLSGAIQDNFLLFWYGTGQNGKNTFGDLIAWILGDYAKVIPIDTLIANKNNSHPTTLANLRGLRLAVCSEVSEGAYWDEARVKSLTGDTEISARFMRQDFFEFQRTHKHLVYGNHRPMLRIVDPGMQSRLHIVPFKAHFPPDARDPDMRRKLEAEAPQILTWLIAGHERWLEDGYLKKCLAVQAETDSYFEAQSTNDMWLAEACVSDGEAQESAKALYLSFKLWKESRGEGVQSQTRWGEWMGQRFVKHFSSGRVWYSGVALRPQSVLDFQA